MERVTISGQITPSLMDAMRDDSVLWADYEGAMQCDTNDIFDKTNQRNNIKQRIKLSCA